MLVLGNLRGLPGAVSISSMLLHLHLAAQLMLCLLLLVALLSAPMLFFCCSHNFPIDSTPNTLSFYMVHMVHHIKPSSVSSYFSGICNELELFYPNVHKNHCHHLVTKTLQCYKKSDLFPPCRNSPSHTLNSLSFRMNTCLPTVMITYYSL